MSISTSPMLEKLPIVTQGQADKVRNALAVIAVAAGFACALGAINEPNRFFGSYLTALLFALSIAVGALFWVMVHHLTGAAWSVVLRRLAEHLTRVLPLLALLFLPVVFGMGSLFSWCAAGHEGGSIIHAKQPYLNVPFFLIRAAIYFGVWIWLALRLSNWSAKQDRDGDLAWTGRMRKLSAPGMLLLGVTTTFAAFDWIMSLDPHWYSTIFGVYFWAGSIVGSLAALTALVIALRGLGLLGRSVTTEHLHDLGKLLFSFVIFWAYIAFSQYFLIWYGNIPEETAWFTRRVHGEWGAVAMGLIGGHFVLPFVLLLSRAGKRSAPMLGFVALVVLGFHYIDLYWQIMPELQLDGPHVHWLDGATLAGVLASCGLVILYGMRGRPLIPIRDPQLAESLHSRSE